MLGQLLREVVVVGQLFDFAHAVHQDDFFKALVGVRVADDAHVGGHAGPGAQQIQVLAGQQIVDEEGACGFAADDDFVAHLDVLQPRGEGAVLHLDA